MNMHSQHRARGRSTPLFVLLSLCVLGPACGDDPDAASDDVVIGDTEGGTTGDVPAETGDDPPPPGPDPDSGAPSDDSDGDETDGGSTGEMGPSCDPETHSCNELAPEGWSGPGAIVITDDLEDSACGGAFGETALTVFSNLHADDATCDCSCGNPQGGSCKGTGSIRHYPIAEFPNSYWQNIQACTIPGGDPFVFSLGAVYEFASTDPGRVLTDANVSSSGGSCTPALASDFPEPSFKLRIDACLPTDAQEDCNEYEACQPKIIAPFDGVCIWQPGDLECPAATPYTERTVYHQSFTDERACNDCTCSKPQGSCNPEITLWRLGGIKTVPADGTCTDLDASYTGVSFDPGDPQWGPCTPSGGELSGEVSPAEPVTFCCMA